MKAQRPYPTITITPKGCLLYTSRLGLLQRGGRISVLFQVFLRFGVQPIVHLIQQRGHSAL